MPTYSDSEMRAIMGRALQIDSGRSERFTPEQLRTIAAELGISTQALEVAMYEADSGARAPNVQAMAPVPATRRWAGVAIAVGTLLIAALGFGFLRNVVVSGRDQVAVEAVEARGVHAAPARAVKTSPPTTEPASPTLEPPTKAPTRKVR